jgi:HK97 gp10 family phage protein
MKTVVHVEGLRELDAALNQFTPRKRRAIGRVALDSAGEILAKAARSHVPVDTGGLRESIDVSGTLTRSQKAEHSKQAEQERFVGPDGRPQGHLREFGGDGNPPQPYMRPAWDETKQEVLDRIGDELWIGIDKAVQSEARRAARGR